MVVVVVAVVVVAIVLVVVNAKGQNESRYDSTAATLRSSSATCDSKSNAGVVKTGVAASTEGNAGGITRGGREGDDEIIAAADFPFFVFGCLNDEDFCKSAEIAAAARSIAQGLGISLPAFDPAASCAASWHW